VQQSWLPVSQHAFSAAQHSASASQHFSWPSQQASPFWQQAGFSAAAQHPAPASQQGKPNAQQSSPVLAVPPAFTVVIAIANAANEANAIFVNMISLHKGGPHITHFSAHGDRIEKQKKLTDHPRTSSLYPPDALECLERSVPGDEMVLIACRTGSCGNDDGQRRQSPLLPHVDWREANRFSRHGDAFKATVTLPVHWCWMTITQILIAMNNTTGTL